MSIEHNRLLGSQINRDIWNDQRFELIPEYYAENFVADYSPRVVREGRDKIQEMVLSAHSTFEGFKETIHTLVADEDHIVVHFTITGRQVKPWGTLPASGKQVKYDEIVIMQVADGKVCRQIGVQDTLLALQQLGFVPDPSGFTDP